MSRVEVSEGENLFFNCESSPVLPPLRVSSRPTFFFKHNQYGPSHHWELGDADISKQSKTSKMWMNAALICSAENTTSCVPWNWVSGGKVQGWGSLITLVVLLHISPAFELHRPGLSTLFKVLVHLTLLRIGDVLSAYCFVSWGFTFFFGFFCCLRFGQIPQTAWCCNMSISTA